MSPAYRFHPEFGYFCPTPSFRYKLRVALLFLVIGGIAGFGGMLVLKAAHHPATGNALTFARVDDSTSGGEAISSADHAESATTGQRSGASEGGKSTCEDNTWAYLDGKCVSGRPRKARTARTTTNRPPVAAIPLGSAPPPGRAVEPASAPLSAADRHQLPAGAAEAAPANPGITKPTEQAAAAPKKARKTAGRQSKGGDHRVASPAGRDGRPRDNQSSARAYADDRNSQRGPFGGGGPFGEGGLFGSGGPFGSLFR
jgi:hypothetical protein